MNRDRSRVFAALAGAAVMTGCAPAPASSEPQGRILSVDQVAGYWALRGPDGSSCMVSLANLVIDGVRPVLAESCGVPDALKAKSWRATATGFEMLAADGSVVMAFRRIGDDAFEGTAGGFTLRRAAM